MSYSYSYINKSTGEKFSLYDIEKAHRADFDSYGDFLNWIDQHYKEGATMWKEGSLKIHDSIFHYWMKQYDEGSQYGIEGGRISKLMLKRNGEVVCNYDRGWDIKPVDTDTQLALELLLHDDTYESGLGGMGALDELADIDQHHPGRYANPNAPITNTMQRQLDEVLAFEDLRMDGREELGLGRTRRENFQGENGMQASDVPEPDDGIGLVIEMPRSSLTDAAIDNLRRLIGSKATLVKKALGADNLEIEQTDELIRFPWFCRIPEPEVISATTHFIEKMLTAAKSQKRVTALDNT